MTDPSPLQPDDADEVVDSAADAGDLDDQDEELAEAEGAVDSDAAGFGDDDDEIVSPFAAQGSPRPTDEEAQGEAKVLRIRSPEDDAEGRSPVPTLPLILRDLDPEADRRPSTAQVPRILRAITQLNLLILQFLYDYRYLNTSPRSSSSGSRTCSTAAARSTPSGGGTASPSRGWSAAATAAAR